MPVLSQVIKTVSVKLPVSGATVEMAEHLTHGELMKTIESDDDTTRGLTTVLKKIKKWDLLEDDGITVCPISLEKLELLPYEDTSFLATYTTEQQAKSRSELEKKEAAAVVESTPEETPTVAVVSDLDDEPVDDFEDEDIEDQKDSKTEKTANNL